MRWILLRHGETVANKEGRYSGWTEHPLTDKGVRQLNQIKNLLAMEQIDLIYTSPLLRTVKMAEAIGLSRQIPIRQSDHLKEINFGIFEGMTYQEIQIQYQREWQFWTNDYIGYQIPQGESLSDLVHRVQAFINTFIDRQGTVVVVTHGGVIRVMITLLLGMQVDEMWHFKIPPGALVEIEYKNYYGVMTRLVQSANE